MDFFDFQVIQAETDTEFRFHIGSAGKSGAANVASGDDVLAMSTEQLAAAGTALANQEKLAEIFPQIKTGLQQKLDEMDRANMLEDMTSKERVQYFGSQYNEANNALSMLMGENGAKYAASLGLDEEGAKEYGNNLIKKMQEADSGRKRAEREIESDQNQRFNALSTESKIAELFRQRDEAEAHWADFIKNNKSLAGSAKEVRDDELAEIDKKLSPLMQAMQDRAERNRDTVLEQSMLGQSSSTQRMLLGQRREELSLQLSDILGKSEITADERDRGMSISQEMQKLTDRMAETGVRLQSGGNVNMSTSAVVAGTVQAREADARVWQKENRAVEMHTKDTAKNTADMLAAMQNLQNKTLLIETP